jgi:Ca2+-transporting ATPase
MDLRPSSPSGAPDSLPLELTPVPAAGLTEAEAAHRLAETGPNELERAEATSRWALLARQLQSPLIWLLAGACVVSALLGEVADALAIGAILVVNALVGYVQEQRAERAILALRSMTAPRAQVVREGRVRVVSAVSVVPGDVLVLEAGEVVAADARVCQAQRLATNEAPLTGESVPVEKGTAAVPPGARLAERADCVFMGTAVAAGTGRAVVFATGRSTELGRIAHLLATAEDGDTPLQKRLAHVSRILLYLCLGIVAAVAAVGLLRGLPPFQVFMSAVSLAVAAVPEGLPAIVTIALAIGVQRMAARNVLIRKLPAVEALGCATVICTDKTGTLTTGVMAVRELWGADHNAVIEAAAACCDAQLGPAGETAVGDPTEIALLREAYERGIRRADIERARPRVAEMPFDSTRKRMSVRRADGVLYVKGAVESVVACSTEGTVGVLEATAEMASRGLRVLAVAVGQGTEESNLRLLGLVGIADAPRTEAIAAVAAARAAGIRPIMITGDHPITAQAIGREMGILRDGDDPSQVIHARATPEEKLQIVRDWKARGQVVAMTGDGVNDAPALREADIGIAMGKTGTEVTRESSDVILADDNFASIVAGVREGRGIFENIRKSLVYLLTGNAGELAVMLAAGIIGLPLPLLPLHLLWINLVTDGFPALALVMDPPDPDVMARPPRRPDEPMLGRAQWLRIGIIGALEAAVVLGAFLWALRSHDLPQARGFAFSVIVFAELFRAFAARSPTRVLWELGVFTNARLVAAVALSVLAQLAIMAIPAAQTLFQVGPLSFAKVALTMALGLLPVTVLEVAKLLRPLVSEARIAGGRAGGAGRAADSPQMPAVR